MSLRKLLTSIAYALAIAKATASPTALLSASVTGAYTPTIEPQSTPTYYPVSEQQAGSQLNNDEYYMQSLGNGGYFVTDGGYNHFFLVACHSVIVVDAPATLGINILKAIRSVTDLPVSHVVYSHHHADHISAAYLLGTLDNVTFIAQKETATKLAAIGDYGHRLYPTITFEDSYTLNLGEAEDLPGYIKAHEQVMLYDFEYFVGGHVNVPGNRTDVQIAKEYVLDLFETCKYALLEAAKPYNNGSNELSAEFLLGLVTAANPSNPWAPQAYFEKVITEWVANVTIPRWDDRLAAIDVYGLSNSETMLEPVKIDYGILGSFGVKLD
ncbi:hypothetical protein M409DRAFT_54209 [Zasmidium cellare ATCC 36951]|uniref:Metallo-beta-lactamase domain-containing protein n=1 Tax=Zasmidium cellare ATCC 36951 TaxID=1080233 RepID=A0A6A6CNB6_ZASCE|nr:uncharacterized protein M409DRAFT_54209 [Zasmidium cellare ATCC 36951]KAF2167630.1 hypothetical protein M409DRAFT_54209 [Zasmidium cellare ATCC 36951]